MDHIYWSTDLRREDLDLEEFAHALALQHLKMLIANGGSDSRRPDLDDVLSPHHLEAFLARVMETTWKTKRFKPEWERLCQLIPRLQEACGQGQVQFHEDLHRAGTNEEEMEYLSEVDFAADCYASCVAHNMYPRHYALQAWVINGYMLAWRQHFLVDEDISLQCS